MELTQLQGTDQQDYNSFVAANPSGSFLQSWQWGAWQEHLGHEVYRFFIKENGTVLLSAQVIKSLLPRIKKYYLYIPYGPLTAESGTTSTQNILDFFVKQLRQKFADAIFVRIEPKQEFPSLNSPALPTPHVQPGKTLIIDLSLTPEQMLSEMHPKTRYNIRVAEKHQVEVQSELVVMPGHGLHLQEALTLLMETAKRQHYKSHGREYYKKFIDFFGIRAGKGFNLTIYKAFLEQKLLACGLIIDFAGTRTYIFGGTSESSKNVMAPYALHWQAILDAKNKGFSAYDFWGIETAKGATPGFVRFKLGFGGTAANYANAFDIVWRPVWYNAYKVIRNIHRKIRK